MVRIGKKEAVFFGVIICLAVLVFLASAYGTNNPSFFGHSAGEIEGGGIPSGAVMAFNLAACPAGWSPYSSAVDRMVIGSGSSYSLGASGGEATHVLTIGEMPAHSHSLPNALYLGGRGLGRSGNSYGAASGTGSAGSGAAHNNMPPYVALLYCQKD